MICGCCCIFLNLQKILCVLLYLQVWDALTNAEVVKIVASAKRRSSAAKLVVSRAVRAWKCKYPCSKVDDCAVVCLFLKDQSLLANSSSRMSRSSSITGEDLSLSRSFKSYIRCKKCPDHDQSVKEGDSIRICSQDQEWTALQGVSRVNSIVRLPRFLSFGKLSSNNHHEVQSP